MTGKRDAASKISMYQPSQDVVALTSKVRGDYAIGSDILTRPWRELNGRSVIDDENRGQSMFNAFVDTDVEDPNEAWKWRGTRSMARNKGVAMHANLTANFLLPVFMAQNEDDEVDREFSEFMRDVVEWMTQPSVSNYQASFMQAVFGMLTNPVTYLGAEWCEVMQEIKVRGADGKYTTKEVMDDVLSGFSAPIWSSTQVLITNAYERDIQRQRGIVKRRYVDRTELEAKWGSHPNWAFVTPGTRSIYSEEDGLFYDVKDDTSQDANMNLLVEETAMYRRDDVQACFVNGIYLGDDDVDANPMSHRDQKGAPKYDVVPFGFSRIGEHFFYYKSMMNQLGWDNALYDAMSEAVMNRAFLEVDMPIAISGSDEIDSEVIFPKSVVTFDSADAKVTPLMPGSNMAAGFNALRETEKSISEGSVSETITGQLPDASQKAYSVAQAQANSKRLIGAVGKSLAQSVEAYGDLMKDIVVTHVTVPMAEELEGGSMKVKYRSFILDGKGSAKGKVIRMDPSMIGRRMTDDERKSESLKLLERSGYPADRGSIVMVNPEMVEKFDYLAKADVEEMFAKNAEYWQPVLLNLKTQLAADPYTDQEALTGELMYSFFQSRGDKFVKKAAMQPPGAPAFPGMPQAGAPANPLGPKAGNLSTAAPLAVS